MRAGKGKKVWKVLLEIYLICAALLMLFPLLFMYYSAFKTDGEIRANPFGIGKDPFGAFAANLKMVFTGAIDEVTQAPPFLTLLGNSLLVTVVSLAFMVMIATLGGYAIGRIRFKWKSAYMIFLIIAQTVPIFGYLFPLYYTLSAVSLIDTRIGVILVYISVGLPTTIILLSSFFKGFPTAVEEAALVDGCNTFRKFIYIILPMTRGAIMSMAIINFMGYWNEFAIVSLIVSENDLFTLNIGAFFMQGVLSGGDRLDYTLTLLALATVPNLVFFTVFQKNMVSGVSLGAVKG